MKKINLLLTALFVLTASSAFAQTSADATLQAAAEVADQLVITNTNDVEFGLLTGDENAYLSTGVTGEDANTGIISGSSIGSFDVEGSDGSDVQLSWNNPVLEDGSANTLTFTPYLSYDSGGTQTEIPNGSGSLTLGTTATTVSVGGALNSQNAASGVYNTTNSGDPLVVTVSYTTI